MKAFHFYNEMEVFTYYQGKVNYPLTEKEQAFIF